VLYVKVVVSLMAVMLQVQMKVVQLLEQMVKKDML